ncbi:hypothetical protein MMC17_002453 [Xylographa soralifera]|nr:hypothetical protein [Xylographa soralifera]
MQRSGLLDFFKLNASYDPKTNSTTETRKWSDPSRGLRHIREVKTWKRVRKLGEGGCATVWLECEENTPKVVRAIKVIQKPSNTSSTIYQRELEALGQLSKDDEVFVKFHGWYESPDAVFLAMEYVELGDLECYTKDGISESDTRDIGQQLLEGLTILHHQGWAHCDLKPSNIFVVSQSPDWWVKIGDFGISKRIRDGQATVTSVPGTQGYMAPELLGYTLVDEEEKLSYSVAVDMWSFGCVLFRLLACRPPFKDNLELARYCRSKAIFPKHMLLSKGISGEGASLIEKAMAPDPSDRVVAGTALKDPWFSIVTADVVAPPPIERPAAIHSNSDKTTFTSQIPVNTHKSSKTAILAHRRSAKSALRQGQTELARHGFIIPYPPDPSSVLIKELDVKAAVVIIAKNKYTSALKLLVENQVDINARDRSAGCSKVHRLLLWGPWDDGAINFLIESGYLDLNCFDQRSGTTLLHRAAMQNVQETVRLLIRKGADVKAKDFYFGNMPINIAIQHGFRSTVLVFLEENLSSAHQHIYNVDVFQSAMAMLGQLGTKAECQMLEELVVRSRLFDENYLPRLNASSNNEEHEAQVGRTQFDVDEERTRHNVLTSATDNDSRGPPGSSSTTSPIPPNQPRFSAEEWKNKFREVKWSFPDPPPLKPSKPKFTSDDWMDIFGNLKWTRPDPSPKSLPKPSKAKFTPDDWNRNFNDDQQNRTGPSPQFRPRSPGFSLEDRDKSYRNPEGAILPSPPDKLGERDVLIPQAEERDHESRTSRTAEEISAPLTQRPVAYSPRTAFKTPENWPSLPTSSKQPGVIGESHVHATGDPKKNSGQSQIKYSIRSPSSGSQCLLCNLPFTGAYHKTNLLRHMKSVHHGNSARSTVKQRFSPNTAGLDEPPAKTSSYFKAPPLPMNFEGTLSQSQLYTDDSWYGDLTDYKTVL